MRGEGMKAMVEMETCRRGGGVGGPKRGAGGGYRAPSERPGQR